MKDAQEIYDIIVIGGGHNGLTTANLLAKKGKKVLLVEKSKTLGGIASKDEFHPGYVAPGLLHDTSQIRYPLIKSLNLEKYGLALNSERPKIGLIAKDGRLIVLDSDPQKTAASIAGFSQKDALSYASYHSFIKKIGPFIRSLFSDTPPDLQSFGNKQLWVLGQKAVALKRLGNKTMSELLKVAPMSVSDLLDEYFETDFLKAGLAVSGIHGTNSSPRASFTSLNLLIWECLSQNHIPGGPVQLVESLEKAAAANDVDIITGVSADQIKLNDKQEVDGLFTADKRYFKCKHIVSSCTPKETFFKLIKPSELDYRIEQDVLHYRSRGTTAFLRLGLDHRFAWNQEKYQDVHFFRTGDSLLEMEKAFDPIKYRKRSDHFVMEIHFPSFETKALAPEGCHVVSVIVHFVPFHYDKGWTSEEKAQLQKDIIQNITEYFPALDSAIVSAQLITPSDLETAYGLTEGHIYQGEQAIDQLITRPFPSCSQYATPIKGLFLCGSSTFPGGGISCAPGALAAKAILKNS